MSELEGPPEPPPPEPEPEPEPVLPAAVSDAELRDAIGVAPRRPDTPLPDRFDDDELLPGKRRRRTIVIVASSIFGGLVIAALTFLGHANAQRYLITCASDHVAAEQGRAFPPWGSHVLGSPEYKPIALTANAECKPRETEDEGELERWYLEILVDRASTALTTRNLLDQIPADASHASPLDVISAQLDQALLLARAPERRDQRKEVERLIGDVHYWRAAARARDATTALADAARQFDAAAAERPRHQSDAAAWAAFLRRLGDDLHAGPNGVPAPVTSPSTAPEHASAPPGVALPVEPPPEAPAAAPDAGVPSGGVLL